MEQANKLKTYQQKQTAVRRMKAQNITPGLRSTPEYDYFKNWPVGTLRAIVIRISQRFNLYKEPEDTRNQDFLINWMHNNIKEAKPYINCYQMKDNHIIFTGELHYDDDPEGGFEIKKNGNPKGLIKGRQKKRNMEAILRSEKQNIDEAENENFDSLIVEFTSDSEFAQELLYDELQFGEDSIYNIESF